MTQSKLLILLALLAGLGLGAWARDAIQSEPVPVTIDYEVAPESNLSNEMIQKLDQDSQAVINELRAELGRAELERNDLRAELESLSERINELGEQPATQSATRADAAATARNARRRSAGGLTVAALTDAGISERDAGAIKSRLDELSMQRLYLRDQAQREGWLGKEEYRDQIRQLNDAQNNLNQEFGEDNYSRYLYATGRPNQVSVQSVIENSPAYNAGMQTGDQLVAYDNQTVYDARAIRRGTQSGSSGEMVPVVVMRNGQRVELYVPRGPLGITMDSQSVRPPDSP